MKLYLVQHGEAEGKDVNPGRPLTDKGHDDIRELSQFLKQSDIQLEQVIHSGKLRAKETAEYFVKLLNNSSTTQINTNINPNDSLEPLLAELESWESDSLVVGHLPYVGKIVSQLVTGNDALLSISFQPGSIVCLERSDEQKWQLNWMVRPELLGD